MKIYVMTHKKFDPPAEEIYSPLHVGRALGSDLGYPGDDTGENISDLNPLFGELTGLYWVWQNDRESDYVGVCHYRRFFGGKDGGVMTEPEFEELLKEYDCLTSDLVEGIEPNFDGYAKAHPIGDMLAVRDSLEKLFPEYIESFDSVMKDNKLCYGNICLMPREMFDAYCSWLFPLLFDASENIDVTGRDLYQQRVYGFLSELLLDVFLRAKAYNVGRIQVICTDEKAETKELRLAVDALISQGKFKEARELFENIIKLRPDVSLPMSDVLRRVPIMDFITGALVLEENEGTKTLINVGKDLSGLINHYKNIHEALSLGGDSHIKFLKEKGPSPVAAAFLVKNDISKAAKFTPLDESKVDEILKIVYNDKDFKAYLAFKNRF